MSYNNSNSAYPAYAAFLVALCFLFFLRVIGQLIQYVHAVAWLPRLETWQGSTLPYGLLLFSQLVILVFMLRITSQHVSGCIQRNPIKGKWLLGLGALYFFSMSARLIIGLASLSIHPWFNKPLPALFHLVLAAYVLMLAGFHMNWIGKRSKFTLSEEMR